MICELAEACTSNAGVTDADSWFIESAACTEEDNARAEAVTDPITAAPAIMPTIMAEIPKSLLILKWAKVLGASTGTGTNLGKRVTMAKGNIVAFQQRTKKQVLGVHVKVSFQIELSLLTIQTKGGHTQTGVDPNVMLLNSVYLVLADCQLKLPPDFLLPREPPRVPLQSNDNCPLAVAPFPSITRGDRSVQLPLTPQRSHWSNGFASAFLGFMYVKLNPIKVSL